MTNPPYRSVTEMTKALANEPEVAEQLQTRIASRKVVKFLIAQRCKQGFSQADIAKAMGCTQSRVSKLESGVDQDLRLGDLEAYLHVLGLQPKLQLRPEGQTVAEAIKYHWAALGQQLDHLLEQSRDNASAAVGVGKLTSEMATQYIGRLMDQIHGLPLETQASGSIAPGIELDELAIMPATPLQS
ncbi:MAG: helix-turn-helix transcriptional regulator [Pirellulales bacterium]